MSNHGTTLTDHSGLAQVILRDVERFIDTVGERNCTSHLKSVTTKGKYLKGAKLGQKPERFTEDHLIFPILQTLGHTIRPQPMRYAPKWKHGSGIPDFALTTVPVDIAKESGVRLFGECKPPNKLHYAKTDVEEYLEKDLDFHAVVLLTDGIDWELWIRHRNQPLKDEHAPYVRTSLQNALADVKSRNYEKESYQPFETRKKIDAEAFSAFTAPSILSIIDREFGVRLPQVDD